MTAHDPYTLQVAHTSALDPGTLAEAEALLRGVFEEDFTAHDWEHSLGGMHVLLRHDGLLVGHAAVVQRRLLHRGHALRTGYVEGVGVHTDRQRRGLGSRLMAAVEGIVRGGYEVGALGSSEAGAGLYRQRGWQVWQGTSAVLTRDGVVPTPEETEGIHVLPVPGPGGRRELDLTGELVCDFREGDVW